MNAIQLYAQSQQMSCSGDERCHWCGNPCQRLWLHDDAPPIQGVRPLLPRRVPSSHWICQGCWLFRRKRLTIWFVGGGYKDGQCPQNWSWWVTPTDAKAVRLDNPIDLLALRGLLLRPPLLFSFSIKANCVQNHLHMGTVADEVIVRADTPLAFSADNLNLTWSVYELDEALRKGSGGKSPGVQLLAKLLAPVKEPLPERKAVAPPSGKGGKLGRPGEQDRLVDFRPAKVIAASGQLIET